MQYQYQTPDGALHSIDLIRQPDGSYTAIIDGQTYSVRVQRWHGSTLNLLINDQPSIIQAARAGSTHYIACNGQITILQKVMGSIGSTRATRSHQAGDLSASMPGQITQVLVAAGDKVEKGQTLIIMEAMKMEMRIKAPYAGLVKQLLCAVGETVDRGQVLVEIAST